MGGLQSLHQMTEIGLSFGVKGVIITNPGSPIVFYTTTRFFYVRIPDEYATSSSFISSTTFLSIQTTPGSKHYFNVVKCESSGEMTKSTH